MTRVSIRTNLPATHAAPPAQKPVSMSEWQAIRDAAREAGDLPLWAGTALIGGVVGVVVLLVVGLGL